MEKELGGKMPFEHAQHSNAALLWVFMFFSLTRATPKEFEDPLTLDLHFTSTSG